MSDRLPPQNKAAESAVLGTILRDNSALDDVMEIPLHVEDFYFDSHRKIFAAFLFLKSEGIPSDLVTVANHLNQRNEIQDIGHAYLAELWDRVSSGANSVHYGKIVKDLAITRRLIHVGADIVQNGYAHNAPAENLLEHAESALLAIGDSFSANDAQSLNEILVDTMTRIDARGTSGVAAGLATGYLDIDAIICGLQHKELSIIGARPSIGKTSLAVNIALNIAEYGHGVLFISLEQSKFELSERMLCRQGRVDGFKIRKGNLNADEVERLIEASGNCHSNLIHIDDRPALTPLQITATIRRYHRRHDIKLVIIDYLQMIEPEDRRVNRAEQLDVVCQRLKNIAKETNTHVCALSQLNREGDADKGKPRLRNLRDSGGIEANADLVILLYKEEKNQEDNTVGVSIQKNRNGRTGEAVLTWLKAFMRFENTALGDLG